MSKKGLDQERVPLSIPFLNFIEARSLLGDMEVRPKHAVPPSETKSRMCKMMWCEGWWGPQVIKDFRDVIMGQGELPGGCGDQTRSSGRDGISSGG